MSVWDWSTTAGTNSASDAAINWAEGQLPSTVNNSARAMMAALKAFVNDTGGVTTAGSSNAYTLALTQTMTTAAAGIIAFKADRANTGAATMNVDSLGANPLRFQTGVDLGAGDIVEDNVYLMTWVSGTSEWLILNGAMRAVSPVTAPGGRLTLTSATPVLTSTVSGATTVYYTPHMHDTVPIWNGSTFIPTRFAELSQTTADSGDSPAAVTTNSNYDVFVWNDAGTLKATRGPAWSSDTARGTGAGTTQLTRVRGIYTNTVSITNGPGAGYGTYVGTIRSDASSQINFNLGGSASGGTAGVLGVWNMYNRVDVVAAVQDSGTSYTYVTATARSARASDNNRVSFVTGFAEDAINITAQCRVDTAAAVSAYLIWGIGLDSKTVFSNQLGITYSQAASIAIGLSTGNVIAAPQIGFHYVQLMESGDGTNANTVATTLTPSLLEVVLKM